MAAAVRLKRAERGLTQEALAKAIGKTKGFISGLENAKWGAGRDTVRDLADAFGCAVDDLFRSPETWAQEGVDPKYVDIPEYRAPLGLSVGGRIHDEHVEIAGLHKYRRDWIEGNGWRIEDLAVTIGEGHSMAPNIKHGDKLLVHRGESDLKRVISGEVYVISDPYLGTRVKRLYRMDDGRILVRSDNEDRGLYPDEYLTPESTVVLVGRVVDRSGRP